MSAHPKKTEKRRSKGKAIFIFGEDSNDCYAIKSLIEALRPGLAVVEVMRRPMILGINAHQNKRNSACEEIARLVAGRSIISEVIAVVAHRDCDEVEPAHLRHRDALLSDLRAFRLPNPIVATPAFEIEAWWFLWPEALQKTRGCWSTVTRTGQFGRIPNAKEQLRRDLRPANSNRCPDYRESDSRAIAENVKALGIVRRSLSGSESFTDFVKQVDNIA